VSYVARLGVDLTATSKGHPSGIWSRILPGFMQRWFTWKETQLGRIDESRMYTLYNGQPVYRPSWFMGGALTLTLDSRGELEAIVAGVTVGSIRLPIDTPVRTIPVHLTGGGFVVDGTVTVSLQSVSGDPPPSP
jgi:hypothetical protein